VEIQNLSEGIILAILSEEPNITSELATVVEALNADQACDLEHRKAYRASRCAAEALSPANPQ